MIIMQRDVVQNPINQEGAGRSLARKIVRALAACLAISGETVVAFKNWMRDMPSEALSHHLLRPLQRHLSFLAIHQATNVSSFHALKYKTHCT